MKLKLSPENPYSALKGKPYLPQGVSYIGAMSRMEEACEAGKQLQLKLDKEQFM